MLLNSSVVGFDSQVQTGEVDMGLGADQGGSIRMPACWTGIVGLKPTYGLVPYTGIPSLSTAIDVCGPMTRTVKDCALMLEVSFIIIHIIWINMHTWLSYIYHILCVVAIHLSFSLCD